jgi:hypothetical protein
MRAFMLAVLRAISCAVLLAAALAIGAPAAQADPKALDAFGAASWPALQRDLPRPAVVIFTTTDCVHCPALIEQYVARKQHLPKGRGLSVVAVVMDADTGDVALLKDAHYRHVDRLMAFEGAAARLRFGIDPRWMGVTPYTALLPRGEATRFVMGPPEAADWQWLLQ